MRKVSEISLEHFQVLKKTKHSVAIPTFADDGDERELSAGRSFEIKQYCV
jgi:hypothetical protein